MALLQIAEPGMSEAPHQRRLAVGIDLGTTNSLVASVRSGAAEVLRDEDGHALMPSVVRYLPGGAVRIGREAAAAQADDPQNTIVSVKRFMGRSLQDVAAMHAPYRFVDAPGMVRLDTLHGEVSPVEVSAQILAKLRQLSEDVLADDIVGAVEMAKSMGPVRVLVNSAAVTTTGTWPEAVTPSMPHSHVNASVRNVPVPGPKKPS